MLISVRSNSFYISQNLTPIRALGANPSSEEQDDALEEGAITVNNVVHSFRLQTTSFDKKSYLTYLKAYMKAVKAKLQDTNPDQVDDFEKSAQNFAKKIVSSFKDYEFVCIVKHDAMASAHDLFCSIPANP